MLDCEFVVLSPENFEEVVTFHDKHFLPQNPLVKALGFHLVDNQTREGRDGEMVRGSLCSGVSFGARVRTSGELVGIILSQILYRNKCYDPDPGLQLIPVQENVNTILELTWEGVDMYENEKTILDMFILCVAEEHARKGLASRLVKETIRLGVAAGCNRAVVTITNQYSGFLYKKLGFNTVKTVDLTKLGSKYTGRPMDIDTLNGTFTIFSMIKQDLSRLAN